MELSLIYLVLNTKYLVPKNVETSSEDASYSSITCLTRDVCF